MMCVHIKAIQYTICTTSLRLQYCSPVKITLYPCLGVGVSLSKYCL